jgi:hypothetical protein
MPHPRSHLAADTQAIGLFGAKSARPVLGSINAGTPLTDRLIPGTVVGIDLLLGRLLRRFCFLDLFCETDPVVGIKVIAEPALYGIKAEAGAL